MKHKLLRKYLKSNLLSKEHILKNCKVILDGKCLFNSFLYKSSECGYMYGCECDVYADYVKERLGIFINSNITLYIIFNGAMVADFEFRKKRHDMHLKKRSSIGSDFYDPIFVKDVNAEVLDELGIKYFICEFDCNETILCLAKQFNCPVITNKIDYCLYGVSCIPVNYLKYDSNGRHIKCNIYDKSIYAEHFKLQNEVIPLFIMLTDVDSVQSNLLSKLFRYKKYNMVPALLDWLNSKEDKKYVEDVVTQYMNEEEENAFMLLYAKVKGLVTNPNNDLAKEYFSQSVNYWNINKNDDAWFSKAVSVRRICVPYVNLKHINQYSGCWMIYDENKNDAMLAAIDIVSFIHCILTNSKISTFNFIGRQSTETHMWEISKSWEIASNAVLFESQVERDKLADKNMFESADPFNLFLKETVPGFNHNVLFTLHKNCWLLVITLIFYVNKNRFFVKGAYSILLSYIVLDRVVECLNKSSHSIKPVEILSFKDCAAINKCLRDLFKLKDFSKFDHSTLHDFAEFQHCLQHMNYLNKICGEKIRCTKFQNTYNGTFVYNIYQIIKDSNDPGETLKQYIGCSYVFMWYKKYVNAFDTLLSLVMIETDKKSFS